MRANENKSREPEPGEPDMNTRGVSGGAEAIRLGAMSGTRGHGIDNRCTHAMDNNI
jgi:hypothetical protein